MAINNAVALLLASVAILSGIHIVSNVFARGVRRIPGPWAARVSNCYRLWNVSRGQNHRSMIVLHKQYGDNVRIGPRVVSIRNLEDINLVYGIKSAYSKSDFYVVQQQLVNGSATQTLFTTINEKFHTSIKRPVANAYSMTTLIDYEPLVEKSIDALFWELTKRYAELGTLCPLFDWLQYYAFDVIAELTCSEAFGFIKAGRDIDGIIDKLNATMDYNAIVGQMPSLDLLLKKNPVIAKMTGATGPVAKFARDKLALRLSEQKAEKQNNDSKPQASSMDFVDKFFRAKEMHPNVVDNQQILSYMITNMFAGSDTTAISLRAIIYYILKNPEVHRRLLSELDEAHQRCEIGIPITWHQSQELEYFKAVVQEALRLHPAVGLILERCVPAEGLKLVSGAFLPAGTIVGASPWVVHHHKPIFGEDADDFRPERWLQGEGESHEAYQSRLRRMNAATMTFGKGHRTCIGKNISLLEIYKLIPSLFLMFKIEIAEPQKEWTLRNSWFVRQEGLEFQLQLRRSV